MAKKEYLRNEGYEEDNYDPHTFKYDYNYYTAYIILRKNDKEYIIKDYYIEVNDYIRPQSCDLHDLLDIIYKLEKDINIIKTLN